MTQEDCTLLAGMMHYVKDHNGYRIEAFGEPFCMLMNHRMPCEPDCPDRRQRVQGKGKG